MVSKFISREVSDFAFSGEWLGGAMLFIAGARQCGKTSLTRKFLDEKKCSSLYFNLDVEKIRRRYRNDPDFIIKEASRLEIKKPYVVLDEIHKLTRWKNILKGLFDEFNQAINIIVTGSARLDLFRRSGDSLAGRYTLVNLFPFSFREWAQITGASFPWLHEEEDWKDPAAAFSKKLSGTSPVFKDIAGAYLTFGPFPAPLISGSMQRSRKWHRDYISLLIREDLRDLSGIRELDRVSHLVELLPDRIGSPLSLRSLAGDLEANHSTVKNWLLALQKLYLLWPLRPHSAKFQRTIRKEPKWYFLNWIYAGNEGSRFENMIVTSLYRFVVSLSDRGWPEVKLHYLKTYDKKEINFILFLNKKPILAVESKIMSKNIPPQLIQLRHNYGVDFPIVQVINQPGVLLKKGLNEYIAGYDRLLSVL
ncbi:MAG: ATP-binding protein [Deltaproteobacteria bacterium]|nr:ATP-binding protein [Deltaproteobacteria bacterium]